VLRVQKGPEMREICGTIEGTSLAKEAVVSVGDTETIQYVSLCQHFCLLVESSPVPIKTFNKNRITIYILDLYLFARAPV